MLFVGIGALINYVDFVSAFLIIFNMIGVYLCSNEIVAATKEYFSDVKRWETEKWSVWEELETKYNAQRKKD